MPQLRYDLIGDASSFVASTRDMADAAELTESQITELQGAAEVAAQSQAELADASERTGQSIGGLEEVVEQATRGQIQYNEAAERFQNTSGQFVAGAEAQEQALVGVIQENQRLQRELRQTDERSEQVGQGFNSVQGPGAELGFLLQDLGAAGNSFSGAIRGAANNIPGLVMEFQQMRATGTSLASIFTGTGGLLIGVNALAGALPLLISQFSQTEDTMADASGTAEEFGKKVDQAADSVFRLADASREGLTTTRQFAQLTIQELDSVATSLDEQLSALEQTGTGARFTSRAAPSISVLPPEDLERQITKLEKRRDISESALETLREQIQQRRVQNRLLEVQRESVAQNSTLTETQVSELQRQAASLKTITASISQGVISQQQAAQLAESRVRSAEELKASQAVINELVTRGVISIEDLVQGTEDVKDAQNLLNRSVEAGLISQEQAKQLREDFKDDTEESTSALEEANIEVEELRQQFSDLRSSQGVALAQAQQTKEAFEGGVQALRNANRVLARRQDGQGAQQVEGAGPAMGNLGTSIDQLGEEVQRLNRNLRDTGDEAENAGDSVNENVNRQLTQSIQLSAQLGATLIQAAQGSEAEWNRVLGSILGTVGGIVSLIPGGQAIGAGITGAGTIVGSFEEGGTMSRSGLAELHPPEIVTGLPGGAQVVARQDTMDMLAAGSQPKNITVRVEADTKRMGPGELGTVIREVERYEGRHPTRR